MRTKVLASVLAVEHSLMLVKGLASLLAVEQRSEYTCRVNKILLKITPTLPVKRFSKIALSSCSSEYIKSRHIGYKLYNLCNKLFCCYLGGTWQTLQFAGNLYSFRPQTLEDLQARGLDGLFLSLFSLCKTWTHLSIHCLLYTSPSPRDDNRSRMPSSA